MREIDTDALSGVASALGVAAPGSATQPVVFDDDNLQQVLDVSGLVGRSRVAGRNHGLFGMNLRTIHLAADSQSVSLNPWIQPANVQSIRGWGSARSMTEFDIWLRWCTLSRVAGAGGLTTAQLILFADDLPGVGIETGGTNPGMTPTGARLATWDSMTSMNALDQAGRVMIPLNMRLPVDGSQVPQVFPHLQVTSAGAAEFHLFIMAEITPVGLAV